MNRKLAAVAGLVATAAVVAAVASAGHVAAKQRVAIQLAGGTRDTFVLVPLTAGAIERDTGTATFCCWTQRTIVRDGQSIEVNNPQMTLTGKHGTLVAQNRIEWVDLPDGWAVMTGTWRVIRGTGVYAGLSGGGRGAGVAPTNNKGKSQFEGFLSPK